MRLLRILLVVVTVALTTQSCEDETESADLFSGVPKNSSLIFETSDFKKALHNLTHTRIYDEVDSIPPVVKFKNEILALKNQFKKDSLLPYFNNRRVLMSVNLSGAEKYDLLFLAPGDRDFEKSIGEEMSRNFKVSQRAYSGADIFQFTKDEGEHSYFVTAYRNLIIFSTSATLIEESIRQINSDFSLTNEPAFKKLYETSNKKDLANLYINLNEGPDFFKNMLPGGDAGFLEHLGTWAELDIQIHNQELIMSGVTLAPDPDSYYLQVFKNSNAQKSTGQKIVPQSSGLWVSLLFENAEQYYRNYTQYLEKGGRLRKYSQILEKLNFDAQQNLLQWVDSEMGLFASAGREGQVARLAYFSCRDKEDAAEKLGQIADSNFIEGYRGIIIKKLAHENALPRFYGSLYSDFHYPYYFVTDDFVIFSDNLPALKGVINDILDRKTLSDNESFQKFNSNLPGRANIKVVAGNPGFLSLLSHVLDKADAKLVEKNSESLSRYQWTALQLNVNENAAFTNFYMEHARKVKEKVTRLWSTQLESQAANVPQLLKNHVNRKYDIAIQDRDYRLYLLDYNGKILWTKMLDGPVMGGITQVDAFKNNKLQMVLNTPTTLYMIDRLGRDVEDFPVKLPESATAPVGVFNYDLSRNYRFVVPAGKKLLNYGIDAKPVKGWDFKAAKSAIITQPQHFAVAGKDVIVVLTEDGDLLQLNRKGEVRYETIRDLPKLRIPFYIKDGKSLSNSEILTIAENGKLYAIHPGGTADNLYMDDDNPADFFIYFEDRYIFSSDDKLFIKSDTKPWNVEMKGTISTKPKAMIFRNDFYAGAFSKSAEEIRLFNKNGELIEGFPVFAQGPFDMGSLKLDGSINVVTYSEDGTLICYRVE